MARRILRRRKWWIITIFIAVVTPALWQASRTEPQFTSTAVLLMEQSTDNYPVFREWVPQSSAPILMLLLRSRSVAEEVVDFLPKASFEELLTHRDERDYGSRLVDLYRRFRGTPTVPTSPKQLVIQELQRARVSFSPRGGGLVEIQASASSPQVPVDVVGAYIEVLQNRTRAMNREQARALREFIESTQANVASTLKEAEEALAEFRKQRGLQSDPTPQLDLVRLAQMEDALADVQINEKMAQARLAFLRPSLAQTAPEEPVRTAPKTAGPPAPAPPDTQILQARLGRLEARYVDLLDRYTESHPLVSRTKGELDEVRGALENVRRKQVRAEAPGAAAEPQPSVNRQAIARQIAGLEAEINSLQVRKQTLQNQVQTAKTRVAHLSKDELDYARLKRTADIQRNMFTMLQEKTQAANARGQGELRSIRVIEPPTFPLGSSPTRALKLALFGIALGGLLAFGAALALDYMGDSVETEAELEALMEAPALGSISRMSLPRALSASKTPLRLPGPGPS